MKRKISILLAVIMLASGIIIIIIPLISRMLYAKNTLNDLDQFQEMVYAQDEQGTDNSALLDQLYRRLQKENIKLYQSEQSHLQDPFAYAQPSIDLTQYGLEDNIIGYLSIPKIGETLPISLGANKENMKIGAAHLTETSYPIGGENTNSVLSAHRGYSMANMFRNLDKLKPGDEVVVKNFRETLRYRVSYTEVILPSEISKVLIQPGKDMVTLITCHPYRRNSHRLVIHCERVQGD